MAQQARKTLNKPNKHSQIVLLFTLGNLHKVRHQRMALKQANVRVRLKTV
jgi:hypothetical protein